MDSFQSESGSHSGVSNQAHIFGSPKQTETALQLSKTLEDMEGNIHTYHVHRNGDNRIRNASSIEDDEFYILNSDAYMTSFTSVLYTNISSQQQNSNTLQHGMGQLSLKELIELEKKPWKYSKLFEIKLTDSDDIYWSKIQLKEAMGERKFR